jgi:hypothetical protein
MGSRDRGTHLGLKHSLAKGVCLSGSWEVALE